MNILYLNNTNEPDNNDTNYFTISNVKITYSTMSFDTWFYMSQKPGTIISQDNGMEISISDKSIILKHPALQEISVTLDETVLAANVWTNLFVMYDGNKLSLALNGITIYEKNIGKLQLLSSKDIYLGKYMTGGFQKFRVYNKCIPFEQINQYIFAPCEKGKLPDVQLYVDFTPENGIQKMPSDLTFGESRYVVSQCFSGLETGEQGFAQDDNKDNSSFCSQQFTAYTKLYLDEKPYIKQKEYILTHQSVEQKLDFKLYFTLKQVHQYNLQMDILGKQYMFSKIFGTNQWFDIMVVYRSNTLELYVDANKVETIYDVLFEALSPGIITIGNNPQETQTSLDGYISYLAIFSKPLGIADAKYFYTNGIYIFEDGIEALYDFSNATENMFEFTHFKKITTGNGAKIRTNISSSYKEVTGEYRVSNNVTNLTAEQAKQAEMVVDLILQYSKEVFGIEVNCTPEQRKMVEATLYTQYHDRNEWQAVFDQPASVHSDIVLALMASIAVPGFFLILGVLGGLGGSLLPAAISTTLLEALQSSFPLAGVFAVAGVVVLIDALIMTTFEEEYPNYDSIVIHLDKVAFNTEPKNCQVSGIAIYNSYNDKTLAQDWTGTNNPENYSNIAYIKSQITKQATIQLELTIKNDFDLLDAKFDLHVENSSLFGTYVIKDLPAISGTITQSLVLDQNKLADAQVGTSKEQIKWWAKLSGNNSEDLGTSYHNVHIITDKCVSPWDIEKEEGYPNVDVLNLFNTLYKNKDNDNIVMELSENIYDFKSFKARKDNQNSYSNVQMVNYQGYDTKIAFDAKRFMDDYKANSMKSLSSLDGCLLLTDLARLQGIPNIKPICLEQNLPYVYYEAIDAYNPQMYTFKNVKFIGDETYTETITQLWRHYAVSQGYAAEKYDFLCYDSYFKVKSSEAIDLTLNNKPFSMNDYECVVDKNDAYYRESLFPKSCFCEIIYAIEQYAKVNVQYPELKDINYLRNATSYTASDNKKVSKKGMFAVEIKRPDFMKPVKDLKVKGAYQVCHLVSFDVISLAIDYYLYLIYDPENEDERNKKNDYINFLENFIWTITGSTLLEPEEFAYVIEGAQNTWDEIKQAINNKDKELAKRQYSQLVWYLNSCSHNLRKGYASWNQAIKDAWDVEAWCYITKDENEFIVLSSNESLTNPQKFDAYNGFGAYKPTDPKVGFYILDLETQKRKDYDIWLSGYLIFSILMKKTKEDIGIPYIYSSNNDFPHVENDNEFQGQVYYLSEAGEWKKNIFASAE